MECTLGLTFDREVRVSGALRPGGTAKPGASDADSAASEDEECLEGEEKAGYWSQGPGS